MLFSLIENLEKIDLILASTSPRRFELLKTLGLDFKVVASRADEVSEFGDNPIAGAIENARRKGLAVAKRFPEALVISADTIVVLNDEVMGKPADEPEAYQMLSRLSGKVHQVYTAYGLFLEKYEQSVIDSVCTDVRFRDLTEEEIKAYIGTGEPFDKAGGYGIQGQGAILVERIDGCYSNVVGFPLSGFFLQLDSFLKKFRF